VTYLTHRRKLTIERGHCDPAGALSNRRYLEYFDWSTWLLFEHALGLAPASLRPTFGVSMPLVDVKARFVVPAKAGDVVEIDSTIGEFRRSSFEVRHRMWKDGQLVAEAQEVRVWAESDPNDSLRLRSKPIPAEIIARFRGG
jgi:4-hydroxybenzoyl-CoA thioesterase